MWNYNLHGTYVVCKAGNVKCNANERQLKEIHHSSSHAPGIPAWKKINRIPLLCNTMSINQLTDAISDTCTYCIVNVQSAAAEMEDILAWFSWTAVHNGTAEDNYILLNLWPHYTRAPSAPSMNVCSSSLWFWVSVMWNGGCISIIQYSHDYIHFSMAEYKLPFVHWQNLTVPSDYIK